MQIERTVDPKLFETFLLSLSRETLYNFNHFGEDIIRSNVQEIVRRDLQRKDKLRFFALEGEMIGYGFLQLSEKPTKKHTAGLGIVIGDRWQGKGFGRQLTNYMIKSAWESGLARVWLNVYSDNPRALKLYQSLGFEIEGVFKNDELTARGFRNTTAMAILSRPAR